MAEVPALNALIGTSARALSRGFYTSAQIEALITHLFGVDSQLIVDQTYYVMSCDDELVACGGWSRRRTLFGGDQAKDDSDPILAPTTEPARIRAFFVHPSFARRGLGRQLLVHCETEAQAAGFRRTELMATLPGVPLYRAFGYEAAESVEHPLPGGEQVTFIRMTRALARVGLAPRPSAE